MTKAASKMKLEESYGQGWELVEDVLREWRYANERKEYAREVAVDEAERSRGARSGKAPTRRKRVARSKLTEDDFWDLIDAINHTASDADAIIEPLVKALAKRNAADIREFHQLLAHKLYLLDERRFAQRAGDGLGDDGFLYARCFVVAKGRRFYEQVMRAPPRFPRDVDLEALLGAAAEAFLRRMEVITTRRLTTATRRAPTVPVGNRSNNRLVSPRARRALPGHRRGGARRSPASWRATRSEREWARRSRASSMRLRQARSRCAERMVRIPSGCLHASATPSAWSPSSARAHRAEPSTRGSSFAAPRAAACRLRCVRTRPRWSSTSRPDDCQLLRTRRRSASHQLPKQPTSIADEFRA